MYTNLTKYRRPLNGINEPKSDAAYWDIASEAFEKKKYKESIEAVLNYINPELLRNVDTDNGNFEISQQHGSALINFRIKDNTLRIIVPFLRIDKAKKIPLMRKAAEINFHPLTLPQIILKDHFLLFFYSTTLDLCQPNKIYDVLKEICLYADSYDDEFIEKYNAAFYKKPKVTPLSSEEQNAVWDHFQEIRSEYKNFLKYFEEKRWVGLQFEIIIISIMSIANMPYVNGMLRSDLEEYMGNMFDGNIEFNYRLDKGRKFLNDFFSKVSRETLFKDLYHAEKFISLKFRGTADFLQREFEEHKNRIYEELSSSGSFSAAFSMQVLFLKVLYDYNLEEKHKTIIYNALEKAGGQDSDVAAKILIDVFDRFLKGNIDNVKPAKKGFLAKLFG